MGKMIDIEDFYKCYMFHAAYKAEVEFNQIINEIKKTESTSKDDSAAQSENDSEEMTIYDAKVRLFMQQTYTIGKDYNAIEVALETMRKYEKIRNIVKNRGGKPSLAILDGIIKVIEDGNDD